MSRQSDVSDKALKDLQRLEVLMVDGHFDYGNGYHGRVYLNAHQLFRQPSTIWRFAQDLIDVLPFELVSQVEVVAGPVTGGALLAHTVAGLLDGRRKLTHPPCVFAPFNVALTVVYIFGVFTLLRLPASGSCSLTTFAIRVKHSVSARRSSPRRAGRRLVPPRYTIDSKSSRLLTYRTWRSPSIGRLTTTRPMPVRYARRVSRSQLFDEPSPIPHSPLCCISRSVEGWARPPLRRVQPRQLGSGSDSDRPALPRDCRSGDCWILRRGLGLWAGAKRVGVGRVTAGSYGAVAISFH